MAKYLLVVPSSAHEGQDEGYNDWYDTTHLADLLAIPGVTSGKRFEAVPSPDPHPANYLAIYELELEDPTTVLREIGERARSGQMKMTTTLDPSTAQLWLYKAR